MYSRWIAALAFNAVLGTSVVLAGGHSENADDGDWDITVGGGAVIGPVSPGIDKYDVGVVPAIDITYMDRVFLRSRQGIGFYAFNGTNPMGFEAGASLGWDFGRDEDDANEELDGLGDIDGSPEFRLFAEQRFGPMRLSAEVAQGLDDDGHGGFRGEVDALFGARVVDFGIPAPEGLMVSAGPFVTFGDSDYLQSLYGVTAQQAARSTRFTQNDQEGGFESAGLVSAVRYNFTSNWAILGSARYQHLIGDVVDSPIVENEGNVSGTLFLTYTFD